MKDEKHFSASDKWLQSYYFTRFAVSSVWVVLALTLGRHMPIIGAALLVLYPLWDAAANFIDAARNGGFKRNPTQALNVVVSGITTIAVVLALGMSMNAVSGVFGAWAAFSGMLQLATGVRRWKTHGAQWAMILSGAQSNLAAIHFLMRAHSQATSSVADVAPYAAFGAFYFLVSAVSMAISARRHQAAAANQT